MRRAGFACFVGALALGAASGAGCSQAVSPAPLRVLVASESSTRGDEFEAFLKVHGVAAGRQDWKALTKESVRGYDVVLLDPDDGVVDAYGQSKRPKQGIPADLGRPVVAVGAAGSYALIPFQLKFGNNG